MKVRIRFSKQGPVKYIGHLDLMRFFQKLMRRAQIPIAYSNGMSRHQIMSFALPLGIGDESLSEYADIELTESVNSTEALRRLNENSAEGIELLSFRELPEKTVNAMASVWAADYDISFRKPLCHDLSASFHAFLASDVIMTCKKTKKGEQMLDLKPLIFAAKISMDHILLRVKCGSVDHVKPELVMQAFCEYLQSPFDAFNLLVKRVDLLTLSGEELISLDDVGKDIV